MYIVLVDEIRWSCNWLHLANREMAGDVVAADAEYRWQGMLC